LIYAHHDVAQFNGFCWCCLCACSFLPHNARGELAQRCDLMHCCTKRYAVQLSPIDPMNRRGCVIGSMLCIS